MRDLEAREITVTSGIDANRSVRDPRSQLHHRSSLGSATGQLQRAPKF
jgi:hypothetical protein